MNGFTYFLYLVGLWLVLRTGLRYWQNSDANEYRDNEIDRTKRVLERDPTNAGTRAKLAEFLIEDGDLDGGIHEFRTAISAMPHGPFTTEWKRKLRDALEIQEKIARGERIPGFNERRVCPKCQTTATLTERVCPRCGTTLHKGVIEWTLNSNTQKEIWLEAMPLVVVLTAAILIFMNLSLEWKGTILISTVMVMGWAFLRSFDN
jgi:hypothetical protein